MALPPCGTDLEKAKLIVPKGPPFDQHLYTEYLGLSQHEYDEADCRNSDIFAERAIAAGSGKSPASEQIAARHLPADKEGDRSTASARYAIFQMADEVVPRDLFRRILGMIDDLRPREPAPC